MRAASAQEGDSTMALNDRNREERNRTEGERGARNRPNSREDREREAAARGAAAKRHVSVMKVVFEKETAAAIEAAQIVEAGYAPAIAQAGEGGRTEVAFASGDIVGAVLRAQKPVAVLDDASYRYAGGGYLRGWRGPEEDLCAEGNLYPILESFQSGYYAANKQTASGELFTSRALAIPGVMFSRNGEIAECAVCAMAAPNRTRALQRNRSERECDLALAERVAAALAVLASFGAQTVVVPAFGCGQAGNPAAEVARLMREWVEAHEGAIPQLVFAVRRGSDADAFKEAFADRLPQEDEKPQVKAEPVEEDEEEDDWERYRISE